MNSATLSLRSFAELTGAIQQVHAELTAQANRAVNISLTLRNWLIGCHIEEYELNGKDRAEYGERLMDALAAELTAIGVSRCDRRELYRYRQFYLIYPQIVEALTPQLQPYLAIPKKSAVGRERVRRCITFDRKCIYDFPAGSIWDFFLDVLGIRKIPTTTERIEIGFETYISMYNFSSQQVTVLRRIKDVFIANLSSRGVIDLDTIFANPIYSRLIGRFEEVNQQFDGRLKEVIEEMRGSFKLAV
jgi:hypothetical protein